MQAFCILTGKPNCFDAIVPVLVNHSVNHLLQKPKKQNWLPRTILKIRTPKIITVIVLNIESFVFYNAVMCPKGADGMASSEDPDQAVPSGAV